MVLASGPRVDRQGRKGDRLLAVPGRPADRRRALGVIRNEEQARQSMDVLGAIGNTSMARLRRVVPPGCAGILVKLEWENPTGSMKDRMARNVISKAEG